DATAAAIAGARGVVHMDGPIPPGTPVGRLSEMEWGWIVAAILFAWISMRARQATAEQLDIEQTIRMTALDPPPWDAGGGEHLAGMGGGWGGGGGLVEAARRVAARDHHRVFA